MCNKDGDDWDVLAEYLKMEWRRRCAACVSEYLGGDDVEVYRITHSGLQGFPEGK